MDRLAPDRIPGSKSTDAAVSSLWHIHVRGGFASVSRALGADREGKELEEDTAPCLDGCNSRDFLAIFRHQNSCASSLWNHHYLRGRELEAPELQPGLKSCGIVDESPCPTKCFLLLMNSPISSFIPF